MKHLNQLILFSAIALGLSNYLHAETLIVHPHTYKSYKVYLSVTSPSGYSHSYDGSVLLPKEIGTHHYNATIYNGSWGTSAKILNICSGSFSINGNIKEIHLDFHEKDCLVNSSTVQSKSISSQIDDCVQKETSLSKDMCTGLVLESNKDIVKAKEHYKKACNNKEVLGCVALTTHTKDKLQLFDLHLKSCNYSGAFNKNKSSYGCNEVLEMMRSEFDKGKTKDLKTMHDKLCSVKKFKERDEIDALCNMLSTAFKKGY